MNYETPVVEVIKVVIEANILSGEPFDIPGYGDAHEL